MTECSFRHLFLTFLCCAFSAFCLTACGPGNDVRLLAIDQPAVSVLPKPNAPTVTVVEFKDARSNGTSVGQRRDRSAFTTSDSPTLWISHALADALSRHGFLVSYAKSFDQARKGNPDYMVTGKLERVWLKESSATYIEAILEAQFTLANREKHLLRENNKSQSSRNWPSTSNQTEEMLRDTMRDLVDPIADKFANAIWKQAKK